MTSALLHPPRCGRTLPAHTYISQDSDRLLVLVLAIILVQNHAPLELILALLYVAM